MNVEPTRASKPTRVPLPSGYRGGIILAITVFLSFSLLFLRFWHFEVPGDWTTPSVLAALLLTFSIVIQIFALWRSLQVEDDDEPEYRRTLRWFLTSILVLFASLLLAAVTYSGDPT